MLIFGGYFGAAREKMIPWTSVQGESLCGLTAQSGGVFWVDGAVVAHYTDNVGVEGSNPSPPTTHFNPKEKGCVCTP